MLAFRGHLDLEKDYIYTWLKVICVHSVHRHMNKWHVHLNILMHACIEHPVLTKLTLSIGGTCEHSISSRIFELFEPSAWHEISKSWDSDLTIKHSDLTWIHPWGSRKIEGTQPKIWGWLEFIDIHREFHHQSWISHHHRIDFTKSWSGQNKGRPRRRAVPRWDVSTNIGTDSWLMVGFCWILMIVAIKSYPIISNPQKNEEIHGYPGYGWPEPPPKSVISCGPSVLVCGGSAESQRTQWDGMVGSTQGASANHRNWLSIVQYYAILYYYNWYDITDILVITCYNYRKNTIRDTRVAIVTISTRWTVRPMRWVGSNRQLNPLIGFLWATSHCWIS